jgi:hypothetical protein
MQPNRVGNRARDWCPGRHLAPLWMVSMGSPVWTAARLILRHREERSKTVQWRVDPGPEPAWARSRWALHSFRDLLADLLLVCSRLALIGLLFQLHLSSRRPQCPRPSPPIHPFRPPRRHRSGHLRQ